MSYLESMFSLQGKTAVVVGGAGVLCGEIAMALSGAGAEIVIADLNEGNAAARLSQIEGAGGSGYFVPVDVTSRSSLENLLQQVRDRSGACHVLINGAGINSATPFLEITEDEYDRIMDINLKGTVLTCQVFGEFFVENEIAAAIINLGSMSGVIPLSRVFTYSMTKAAVHNISKNLAREWAPHGIRVNTLVPGFFPAEQNRKVLTPERIGQIMGHTPMKRFGEAHELCGAVLLMASGAGSFITGAEIVVDGGYAAMTI